MEIYILLKHQHHNQWSPARALQSRIYPESMIRNNNLKFIFTKQH